MNALFKKLSEEKGLRTVIVKSVEISDSDRVVISIPNSLEEFKFQSKLFSPTNLVMVFQPSSNLKTLTLNGISRIEIDNHQHPTKLETIDCVDVNLEGMNSLITNSNDLRTLNLNRCKGASFMLPGGIRRLSVTLTRLDMTIQENHKFYKIIADRHSICCFEKGNFFTDKFVYKSRGGHDFPNMSLIENKVKRRNDNESMTIDSLTM